MRGLSQTADYSVVGDAPFSYDGVAVGNNLNAYYAVVYDGKLFVSDITSAKARSTSTATLDGFSDPYDDSTLPALDASAGFKGQGWYTAVPEPTSAMLLLLGVAGVGPSRCSACVGLRPRLFPQAQARVRI